MMLNWVISSSILILIMIGLRFCLKGKISLRLQYGLWLLVAVRLLFPFSIGEAVMSVSTWLELVGDRQAVQEIVDFTQTPMPTMPYEEAYDSVTKDYLDIGINIENLPEHVLSGTIEDEVQTTMRGGFTPAEIGIAIWIFGMVLLGAGFLFSNIHFSMKLKKDRHFLGCVNELITTEEKVADKLRVYQTNAVETPCMYGLFRPVIYVTDEVFEENVNLQHVLEHEMTHYRHRDYIWSMIRVICLVLHWYNPFVWWAAIQSRNDAELACDEATITRLGEAERASYGRTLIGLTCEKRSAILLTATTMTGSKRSIKERITLIAKKPKMVAATVVVVVLLVILAIGWTFTGVKRPYESFSEWADELNSEEVKKFLVHKGFGQEQLYYDAPKEEFVEFLELLQAIPEEDCYRKDIYADGYEDYFLYFMCGEAEVNLKCLEDKTIEYVYSVPKFAPQGRKLIIDSLELWNYIVDLVNEKGVSSSQLSNNDELVSELPNDIIARKCTYDTTADLNHDGYEDYIEVIKIKPANQMLNENAHEVSFVQVYLGREIGGYETSAAYISNNVGDSHSANGTYLLTQKDGKDYLIYSIMYEQQGFASYTYKVMYFENNQMVTIQSDAVEFCIDPWRHQYWDKPRRGDVIPKFKEGFEPWIENAIILASYDISTPRFISTKSRVIPAYTYYDMVWERNSDRSVEEFENAIGKEEWMRDLYFASGLTNRSYERTRIEKISKGSFDKWYTQYDGSKLQRIDNYEKIPNVKYSGSIPTNDEIIYYRAGEGEDVQDVVYKMIECMVKVRMIPSEDRTCTYIEYKIPEQKIAQIAEHMWFIPFLNGYYAFTGTDLLTMKEYVMSGGTQVTEDGLIPFIAQGSDEQYFHILIEKDGVYRLQRLEKMR